MIDLYKEFMSLRLYEQVTVSITVVTFLAGLAKGMWWLCNRSDHEHDYSKSLKDDGKIIRTSRSTIKDQIPSGVSSQEYRAMKNQKVVHLDVGKLEKKEAEKLMRDHYVGGLNRYGNLSNKLPTNGEVSKVMEKFEKDLGCPYIPVNNTPEDALKEKYKYVKCVRCRSKNVTIRSRFESFDVVFKCEDCGFHFTEEALKECPTCHGSGETLDPNSNTLDIISCPNCSSKNKVVGYDSKRPDCFGNGVLKWEKCSSCPHEVKCIDSVKTIPPPPKPPEMRRFTY